MKGHLLLELYCTVRVNLSPTVKSQTCTVPAQVSALHQTNCLAQKKDESCFSCEVMKLGAECCVWSCPAACFVEAGWVHVWVVLGATGHLHRGTPWQHNLCTQQVMLTQVHWAALILGSAESPTGYSRAVIMKLNAALEMICFSQSEQSFYKEAVFLDFLELLYHGFIIFTSSELGSQILGYICR